MPLTISADELRAAMVDGIAVRHQALGLSLADGVRRALLTVPRHLFTGDDADLEAAYADKPIVTKRDERGVSLSSVSAPWLQAMMIGQAAVEPGMRVLEIGSGGYNAALLREVVGDSGSVTTVDIDCEVTDRASRYLATAGYADVEVICADAEFALTPSRTFDAILVTAARGTFLKPGGRSWPQGPLVVPLRTRGTTRTWGLEHQDGVLVSVNHQMSGFVPMQGAGAHRGVSIPLVGDDVVGLWQDESAVADVTGLAGVLGAPRAEAWTGVTITAKTQASDLDLWLATTLPGFCLITAKQEAIDDGTVNLPWQYGTPALVDGPNLAYRAKPRPADGTEGVYEFGAVAHGPDAARVAQLLAGQIRAWDGSGRPSPLLAVLPAGTPVDDLPAEYVLDKRHSRLVISWPSAR